MLGGWLASMCVVCAGVHLPYVLLEWSELVMVYVPRCNLHRKLLILVEELLPLLMSVIKISFY